MLRSEQPNAPESTLKDRTRVWDQFLNVQTLNQLVVTPQGDESGKGTDLLSHSHLSTAFGLETSLTADSFLNKPAHVLQHSTKPPVQADRVVYKYPRFQMQSLGDRLLAGDTPASSLFGFAPNVLSLRRWNAPSLLLSGKKYYEVADLIPIVLVSYVVQKRYSDLYTMLLDLPLEKASPEHTDRLLRILLRRCYLEDDIIAAGIIEDIWENTIEYSSLRHLPLWILIAANPTFTMKDLEFIYTLHEDEGYLSAMNTVATRLRGKSARQACEQLYTLFNPSLGTLRSVYINSMNRNADVEEFVAAKLAYDRTEIAEYPNWLIPIQTGWEEPEDPDIAIEERFEKDDWSQLADMTGPLRLRNEKQEPIHIIKSRGEVDYEVAADVILSPNSEYTAPDGVYSLPVGERREMLLNEMKSWSRNDVQDVVWPYFLMYSRVALANDRTLFRAYGPAHPLSSTDPDDFKLGGDRMLLRSARDDSDDPALNDDEELLDWFEGICEVCKRRIQSRWHCLRMPVQDGGWTGNFCSFECLKDQARTYTADAGDPLLSEKGKSPEELMVDEIEKDIRLHGIQDRLITENDPESIQDLYTQ